MTNKINQIIILCLLFIVLNRFCTAAAISQKLPNSITVSAEYSVGDADKAAVFILHGFLQTRNYLTVQSLITNVRDDGYTVLAPNLSLAISNRKQSLACEAIHHHNMSQDIEEIDYWIKWLEKKGHNEIVLVGHSYGSLQILLYANSKKRISVKTIIATSLIDVEKSNNNQLIKTYLVKARKHIKNNNDDLHEYSISYCKKYLSPAKNYISYAKWTKNKIISELTQSNILVSVILGNDDVRVDKKWISLLKKNRINLIIIDGANHFFDSAFEFDLNEQVLTLLSNN